MKLRFGLPIFTIILCIIYRILPPNGMVDMFYSGIFSRNAAKMMAKESQRSGVNVTAVLIIIFAALLAALIISLFMGAIKGRFTVFLHLMNFLLISVSVMTILFLVLWGINYKAYGAEKQLSIKSEKMDSKKLTELAEYLIGEAKEDREGTDVSDAINIRNKDAEKDVYLSYKKLSTQYSAFSTEIKALKEFPFGEYVSYTGISGLYNPLTAEASYNPNDHVLYRFSSMYHEMAHAYAFAREGDAGLIAYMASRNAQNKWIRYSGTMDVLQRTMSQIRKSDPEEFRRLSAMYSDKMKTDLESYSSHYNKYSGRISETFDKVNDTYLKANGTEGIVEYDDVVRLVYGYLKKEKKL